MPVPGEREGVQDPFVRYAGEVGWTVLSADEAAALRRGIDDPVLHAVLVAQLQALNPGMVDRAKAEEEAARLLRVRPNTEGNLEAWQYLKGLKQVFVEAENRERNLCLLNTDELGANRFHVTAEFPFDSGTPPSVRADLVFFVNGVPVLIVETKAATQAEGIAEAFGDIQHYHEAAPEFLALTQLYALTDLVHFYYGATWNPSRKGLFNWREEQDGDASTGSRQCFETLVKSFVDPARLVAVLTECLLFTRTDDELKKSVLRPHQMRAADRCVERAQQTDRRRGLIWHTQGSGKTFTMITTAKRLIEDPALANPTVLMIVDRNELESQLFGWLEAVGVGNLVVAQSRAHLLELLASDRRGLIVSMIHKFDDIPAGVMPKRNVFVLVDEAHRTTGGDLGNYLMGALPNATYLGFTGTPIDKTAYGKGTFKVFGTEDETGYLDKYSIKESIEDGTTVPLHYRLAPNDLQVDAETLDREFLALKEAEGVSSHEDLNRVLERAVNLRNMLKNPERVDEVARFVAKHFHETVAPMGYKAFLVAVDREACALYKEALDKHLPAVHQSRVVISSAGKKDSKLLQQYHLPEDAEKALRRAFRKPDEQPEILIVTEKLLTGFDAPILYCLYLDKPMRDHVLLQAIALVNRPYEDDSGRRKHSGLVVDFVGLFKKLEKALAFDSKDVEGVVTGLDVLETRFEQLMEQGRREYLPIALGKTGDKAEEAILEHFRNKARRDQFYKFARELQDVYEILSPSAFLRPFVDDYGELVWMLLIVRSGYERGAPVDKGFLRKTAQLVQKHTHTDEVREPTADHAFDTPTLESLANSSKPDTVKVFNLLKALHEHIKQKAAQQPWLIAIGEKAEAIAQAFERGQQSSQEALAALRKLIADFQQATGEMQRLSLKPEAFAVYWFLQCEGVARAEEIGRQVGEAFERHPHWQTSEDQAREVRKRFFKALLDAGVRQGMVDLTDGALTILRRAAR